MQRTLLAFGLGVATTLAAAQSLPPPSRTVFKCHHAGKLVYSDSPCPGAERLEIEPTRGMNQTSGRVQVGADVQRELNREAFAEAIKPLTGMDAKNLDRAGRRMKLSPAAQKRCRQLDQSIPVLEAREKRAEELQAVTDLLFKQRSEFRSLHCD